MTRRATELGLAWALLAMVGCDDQAASQPPSAPNPVSTPAPLPPAPTPTPAPVYATRIESVTFNPGSIEAVGSEFALGARASVEVGVGCHMSFTPFQMTKVDVFSGGGQRIATQRCGPAASPCADIGLTLDLERGNYVVRIERDASYRSFTGYMCDISVRAPNS
jgi:hypothetical protein